MKICFYNPTHLSFSSGPEIWLSEIIPILIEEGHDVTLIMTKFNQQKTPQERSLLEKAKIIELDFISLPFSMSPLPVGFLSHASRVFDVIYVFNGYAFQDLFGLLLARMSKARFVYGVRAPLYTGNKLHDLYQTYVAKSIIRWATAVHVLNDTDAASLRKQNSHVFLSGHGISPAKIAEAIPAERQSDEIFRLIFVGRLSHQKNIDLMLKLIERMRGHTAIKFYIAGDGELRKTVEEAAKGKNLHYLGFVNNRDLPSILKDKHAFLNLSKYETFCKAILEALAYGLPVITTKVAGIVTDRPDLMVEILPQEASVSDIEKAILGLKTLHDRNPARYRALSLRALNGARELTWDRQAKDFIKGVAGYA